MDYGYNVSQFKSFTDFHTQAEMLSTFEHNLKNVLFKPMLDATTVFVQLMTTLSNDQVALGNIIAYTFLAAIGVLALIQTGVAIYIKRLLYQQGKLLLHIPWRESHRQQKKALQLIEEIKVHGSSSAESRVR